MVVVDDDPRGIFVVGFVIILKFWRKMAKSLFFFHYVLLYLVSDPSRNSLRAIASQSIPRSCAVIQRNVMSMANLIFYNNLCFRLNIVAIMQLCLP